MSGWLGVLLVVVGLLALAIRSFYGRFRGMCRRVRDELTELIKSAHPEFQSVEEQRGNLVLRRADGSEVVWELADLYADVARLPGMGQDREARERIYRRSLDALLLPPVDDTHPLTLEAYGDRIKPYLLHPEHRPDGLDVAETLPAVGLQLAYVVDLPSGLLPVTPTHRATLGLSPEQLRSLAFQNLSREFPWEMVEGALNGEATAIQLADGFDASRVLLIPERLQEGQELAAIVPHRDLMVLLPIKSDEELERAREGARAMDTTGHIPLLRQPVRITAAGISQF